jgi:hypothetical protein
MLCPSSVLGGATILAQSSTHVNKTKVRNKSSFEKEPSLGWPTGSTLELAARTADPSRRPRSLENPIGVRNLVFNNWLTRWTIPLYTKVAFFTIPFPMFSFINSPSPARSHVKERHTAKAPPLLSLFAGEGDG